MASESETLRKLRKAGFQESKAEKVTMVYCLDRESTIQMGQVTHDLKTWPEPFEAVWSGQKNFEIRQNDRSFKVGDMLLLREYDPAKHVYTGRKVSRVITYIVYGGQWGMPENLSVLGWAITGCSCENQDHPI